MPSGRKACSKDAPCPACNGASWCFWFTDPAESFDGRNKFCCMRQSIAGDAEVGVVLPVRGYKPARHSGKAGGVVYRPCTADGATLPGREPTPDQRAAEEAKKARWRARNRKAAADIWRAAERHKGGGVGHARAAAYVAHRGVDVRELPLGRLPPSLAFHPGCPRELFGPDGEAVWIEKKKSDGSGTYNDRGKDFVPALVCVMYRYGDDDDGRPRPYVAAVQRIFLDPAGEGKRPVGCGGDGAGMGADKGKMAKGDMAGAFCPLAPRRGDPPGSKTLILCEGVETGLAIAAATWRGRAVGGPGVWACVSTSGLKNLELHRAVFNEEKLERVIIAADYDEWKKGPRHRPGPVEAAIAANRIRRLCPWLRVEVATPSMGVAPGLIGEVGSDAHEGGDEDGAKILGGGKTVDWLDVYASAGADAVERGVMRGGAVVADGGGQQEPAKYSSDYSSGAPVPSRHAHDAGTRAAGATSAGGAGGEPPPPPDVIGRIGPSDGGGDGGGGGAAFLSENPDAAAKDYLWRECRPPRGGGRRFTLARYRGVWFEWRSTQWAEVPDEVLDARLWGWCSGHVHERRLKKEVRVEAFHVTREFIGALKTCITQHVTVNAERVPAWLPPVLGEDVEAGGGPVDWGCTVRPDAPQAIERAELGDVFGFSNGWVCMADLVRRGAGGGVELRPHTTDYFGGASAPYPLPIDALREVLAAEDQAQVDEVYRRICPTWHGLVHTWGGDDDGWADMVQLAFGDAMRTDRGVECVVAVIGKRRSGKTTLVDVGLQGVVGHRAFAAVSARTFDTNNRFGMAALEGKRVAVIGDYEPGRFDDPGKVVEGFKLISGQSMVQLERKGQDPYTTRLGCRVWLVANTLPSGLRDPSLALAGRFVVITFPRSMMGKTDSSIKRTKVPAEFAGIAVWALEGAVRLAEMPEPAIEMTAAGKVEHREFEYASSPMLKFLDECTHWRVGEEDGPREGAWTECDEMYRAYVAHQASEGNKHPKAKQQFGIELRSVVPDLQVGQVKGLGGTGRDRVYKNIALREEWAERAANVERGRGVPYGTIPGGPGAGGFEQGTLHV